MLLLDLDAGVFITSFINLPSCRGFSFPVWRETACLSSKDVDFKNGCLWTNIEKKRKAERCQILDEKVLKSLTEP